MQRDAILALEECELDAKIAEVVFGWKKERLPLSLSPNPLDVEWAWGTPEGGLLYQVELPAYSSTWEGMGLVVAEMKRRGYVRLALDSGLGPDWELWRAEFRNPDTDTEAYGGTAPLAVARAALLALQEEE